MGLFDVLSRITGRDGDDATDGAGDPPESGAEPRPSADLALDDFRDRAETLVDESPIDLDYSAESLARLDDAVAGQGGTEEARVACAGYLGEVLRREFDGEWVREDGWGVAVDLGDDSTTIAVLDAAEMTLSGDPVFADIAERVAGAMDEAAEADEQADGSMDADADEVTAADSESDERGDAGPEPEFGGEDDSGEEAGDVQDEADDAPASPAAATDEASGDAGESSAQSAPADETSADGAADEDDGGAANDGETERGDEGASEDMDPSESEDDADDVDASAGASGDEPDADEEGEGDDAADGEAESDDADPVSVVRRYTGDDSSEAGADGAGDEADADSTEPDDAATEVRDDEEASVETVDGDDEGAAVEESEDDAPDQRASDVDAGDAETGAAGDPDAAAASERDAGPEASARGVDRADDQSAGQQAAESSERAERDPDEDGADVTDDEGRRDEAGGAGSRRDDLRDETDRRDESADDADRSEEPVDGENEADETGEEAEETGEDSEGVEETDDAGAGETDPPEDDESAEDDGADDSDGRSRIDRSPDPTTLAAKLSVDWPRYRLDRTLDSLRHLDVLLADVGAESGDAPSIERLAAYYGDVLVRDLDAEWEAFDDETRLLRLPANDERLLVDCEAAARDCLGAGSFAVHGETVTDWVGAVGSEDGPDVDAVAPDVYRVRLADAASPDAVTTLVADAEAFASRADGDLDYSPASLAGVADAVPSGLAAHRVVGLRYAGDRAERPLATSAVTGAGAYFAAVLVRYLDAQWVTEEGTTLALEGPAGEATVDALDVALDCARGEATFAARYEALRERVGADAPSADAAIDS